jgi:hypothetical protein
MLQQRITDFEFNTRIQAADEVLKQSMVRRIVCAQCCKRNCLGSVGLDIACKVVDGCQAEINGLTRKQKKEYMLEKIRNCCRKKHS